MRYRLLILAALLAGCYEHGRSPRADGEVPCGILQCAPNHHCEAQCSRVDFSCPNRCHLTCVPDTSCEMHACTPAQSCIETGSYFCTGFGWDVRATCVTTDPTTCEQLPDESACAARQDCLPIFRGSFCTCTGVLCSCNDSEATYVRCRTL